MTLLTAHNTKFDYFIRTTCNVLMEYLIFDRLPEASEDDLDLPPAVFVNTTVSLSSSSCLKTLKPVSAALTTLKVTVFFKAYTYL